MFFFYSFVIFISTITVYIALFNITRTKCSNMNNITHISTNTHVFMHLCESFFVLFFTHVYIYIYVQRRDGYDFFKLYIIMGSCRFFFSRFNFFRSHVSMACLVYFVFDILNFLIFLDQRKFRK